jgi:hypothetical protein
MTRISSGCSLATSRAIERGESVTSLTSQVTPSLNHSRSHLLRRSNSHQFEAFLQYTPGQFTQRQT